MFISQALINPQRRASKMAAANINKLHGQVLNAFPPKDGERPLTPLWRLDTSKHSHSLLIVSDKRPDLSVLVEEYGWDTEPAVSKPYDDVVSSVSEGDVYRFRLTANPVHRIAAPAKTGEKRRMARRDAQGRIERDVDGKVVRELVDIAQGSTRSIRVAHNVPRFQVAWLQDRGERAGFTLRGDTITSPLVTRKFVKDSGSGPTVTVASVTFDGVLEVTDAAKFADVLVTGVGRAKSYGCGLLTIARA